MASTKAASSRLRKAYPAGSAAAAAAGCWASAISGVARAAVPPAAAAPPTTAPLRKSRRSSSWLVMVPSLLPGHPDAAPLDGEHAAFSFARQGGIRMHYAGLLSVGPTRDRASRRGLRGLENALRGLLADHVHRACDEKAGDSWKDGSVDDAQAAGSVHAEIA